MKTNINREGFHFSPQKNLQRILSPTKTEYQIYLLHIKKPALSRFFTFSALDYFANTVLHPV
jgi:hypothetical protein